MESAYTAPTFIFKKEKKEGAIAFCRHVKELGYKVFVQAVSITIFPKIIIHISRQQLQRSIPSTFPHTI